MKRSTSVLLLLAFAATTAACEEREKAIDPGASASAAASVAVSAASSADPVDPKLTEKFADLDTNKDGKIALAEVETRFTKKFREADADKGGTISPSEFESLVTENQRRVAKASLDSMDRNGDGKVSRDEADPRILVRFDMLDLDGDGLLSLDDLNAAQMRGGSEGRFAQLDSDGNGAISEREYVEANSAPLKMLDTDRDGAVTMAEMTSFGGRRDYSGAAPMHAGGLPKPPSK